MSNRSYLFSSDAIPGSNKPNPTEAIIGLSESDYEIPYAFKLLVSCNPRKCRTSILGGKSVTAIAGEYAGGLRALTAYFKTIELAQLQNSIASMLEFLNDPSNTREFCILEATEIFWMSKVSPAKQNLLLLSDLGQLDSQLVEFRDRLNGLNNIDSDAIEEAKHFLGIQEWSNELSIEADSISPRSKFWLIRRN